MIASILEAFDFNVRVKGDMVVARCGNMMLKEMVQNKRIWKAVRFKSPEEYSRYSLKIPVFGPLDPVPV